MCLFNFVSSHNRLCTDDDNADSSVSSDDNEHERSQVPGCGPMQVDHSLPDVVAKQYVSIVL